MSRQKRKFEDTLPSACEAAAKLLARREHAPRELELKLRRKGYSSAVLEQAIEELIQRDWLNEERYAAFMARHRCSQGRGPRWVESELSAQGIAPEVCAEALKQDEVDWFAACAYALKRLPSKDPEPKIRQKLYQRGFDSAQISQALQGLELQE